MNKIKLKTNINLWSIIFNVEGARFETIFNSGFIDDIDIVEEYFTRVNLTYYNIKIKKLTDYEV
jgi:hypothetical protein